MKRGADKAVPHGQKEAPHPTFLTKRHKERSRNAMRFGSFHTYVSKKPKESFNKITGSFYGMRIQFEKDYGEFLRDAHTV